MTNLEHLQQDTAEKVAEAFTSWYDGFVFSCPIPYQDDCEKRDCRECFLEWLKSERKL